jgi:excisionase family DNA binding protein
MRNETPIYGLRPGEIAPEQVCRQLRIARATLYEAVKLKQIPVVRRGRAVRFRQDLIDRLLIGSVSAEAPHTPPTSVSLPAPVASTKGSGSTPRPHRRPVTDHLGRHRRLLERLSGVKSRRASARDAAPQ